MFVVLTHDVDWPRKGPGLDHILKRADRFDADVLKRVLEEGFNPYFGIPLIIEYEEELGVRSTFFFRARYNDKGNVREYQEVVKDLVRRGWEIAVHVSGEIKSEVLKCEKKLVEEVAGVKVLGSRVHYLKIREDELVELEKAGFTYDSSIMFQKSNCDRRNSDFFFSGRLIELPITLMDSYMFTFNGLSENDVIPYVEKCIDKLKRSGVKLITLLWHDCSIMMRGGRAYPKLLKRLAERRDLELVRAVDAVNHILRGDLGT